MKRSTGAFLHHSRQATHDEIASTWWLETRLLPVAAIERRRALAHSTNGAPEITDNYIPRIALPMAAGEYLTNSEQFALSPEPPQLSNLSAGRAARVSRHHILARAGCLMGWGGGAMENARTIAVVFHNFPLGGTERIAIRLMNQWAKLGRKVVVFCGALSGPLISMINENIEVVECVPSIPRGLGSRWKIGRAIGPFLKEFRPDVLFVPGNYEWMILPYVAALPRAWRPAVVTQVSTPLYRHGRGPFVQILFNCMIRYLLRCVDTAIALSPLTVAQADKVIGRSITTCIRLPAIDDSAVTSLTKPAGLSILAAGRLVKAKGFEVALRALAKISNQNVNLVILGEGPNRNKLELLARELNVSDRVRFVGYVPDISPWLEQCRVFLLSSYYEGYGAVILEALARGRPVVCTDCSPAVGDLIRGIDSCSVAPIGDQQALALALEQALFAAIPDPAALAKAVEPYRLGPIAAEYLDLFDRAHIRRVKRLRLSPRIPDSAEVVA